MKKIIKTSNAPSAIGTYSQAVMVNGFLYTSGQIGIDPSDGSMVSGGVRKQADRVLNNIEAILLEAGLNKKNIVKLTVFLMDLEDFQHINQSFKEFFDGLSFPARTTVEVRGLPLNALVEIDCVAYLDK